jgi:hypothetical protein
VRSWEFFRYGGPATKVNTRQSVANQRHDRSARLAAKQLLKYPAVIFTGEQARSAAFGFGDAAKVGHYTILACAITRIWSSRVTAGCPSRFAAT